MTNFVLGTDKHNEHYLAWIRKRAQVGNGRGSKTNDLMEIFVKRSQGLYRK